MNVVFFPVNSFDVKISDSQFMILKNYFNSLIIIISDLKNGGFCSNYYYLNAYCLKIMIIHYGDRLMVV